MAFYTPEFFAEMSDESRPSAAVVVPYIIDVVQPKSVIDVGCGRGEWAAEFLSHGVDALGVDGPWVSDPLLPADKFIRHDLTTHLSLEKSFDLAVCLEVAEHLPTAFGEGIVKSLIDLAPTVLFSAAIPGQGGTDHLNEQWQDYWVGLFAAHKYGVYDCVRSRFWDDERVAFYYRQNTLVFAAEPHEALVKNSVTMPLRLVHPICFGLGEPESYTPGIKGSLKALARSVSQSVRWRLQRRR